jgi:hypothetical protein
MVGQKKKSKIVKKVHQRLKATYKTAEENKQESNVVLR